MRPEKNRRFTMSVWILCTICILFSRICFDDVQADPYLAYREALSDSGEGEGVSDPSAFSAPLKGVQTQQTYVPENYGQGSCAYLPRKTAPRTNARSVFGSVSFLLLLGMFFSALFFGNTVLFPGGLDEIISNTVILRYIHGQDGEKA